MGMTIEEAIYHLQELAGSKYEQMGRYDRASGYARSHNEDIRTADAKRLEQRAKECIQLAGWLKDYKNLLGAIEEIKKEIDRDDHADEYCDGYYDGMRKVLAIIDKYKGESEE